MRGLRYVLLRDSLFLLTFHCRRGSGSACSKHALHPDDGIQPVCCFLSSHTTVTFTYFYISDYPSFYVRLYAFLDRNILHLKHRTRFFRMLDLFLSSTCVPGLLN
jgi:hypothetical protein